MKNVYFFFCSEITQKKKRVAFFPNSKLCSCVFSGVATGGAIAPPGSILALKKYNFSFVAITAKHEFHETCHSITFLFDKKRLQTML